MCNVLSTATSSMQETLGLSALKAVVLRHEARNRSQWMSSNVEALLLVAISLIRASLQKDSFPNFPEQSSGPKKTISVFGDVQLDQFFSTIFNDFPSQMLNDENIRWMLTTGDVSFVNVWDLGMNKAVFDVMAMAVPECENVVLLDFFNVDRDADTIDVNPNLGDKCYGGRYTERGDDTDLLALRTKLEYLSYPMFIVPGDSHILVATHSSIDDDNEAKRKAKQIRQKVKVHVDSRKHVQGPVPSLVHVNFKNRQKEDIDFLRRQIEDRISKFRVKLSLKWVVLRTYLAFTKQLYMTLPEVTKIAKKLRITNGEVREFVKQFQKCGSLISIGALCPDCADEFIILRPADFMKEVEKVYYDGDIVDEKMKGDHSKGYISREFAKALWSQNKNFKRSGFFIHTLRRLDILAPLLSKDGTASPLDPDQYFVPRIRPRACHVEYAQDSLYLPHGVVFPFPLQLQFLRYFQQVLSDILDFDPMDYFNTLRFKNLTGRGSEHLTLNFTQMGGHIEISGVGFDKDFRSAIKTACIEVMAGIQRNRPKLKLEYNLAVLCPNVASTQQKHFIMFHPLEDRSVLFCHQCTPMTEVVVEGGDLQWIHAPYKGPRRLVQYHEGNYGPQCILWHLSCVCVGGGGGCVFVCYHSIMCLKAKQQYLAWFAWRGSCYSVNRLL